MTQPTKPVVPEMNGWWGLLFKFALVICIPCVTLIGKLTLDSAVMGRDMMRVEARLRNAEATIQQLPPDYWRDKTATRTAQVDLIMMKTDAVLSEIQRDIGDIQLQLAKLVKTP